MDNFHPQVMVLHAYQGENLLEVALQNEAPLMHQCGGICACSTCHIKIMKGSEHISEANFRELHFLEKIKSKDKHSRLACQCLLMNNSGHIEVQIPKPDILTN